MEYKITRRGALWHSEEGYRFYWSDEDKDGIGCFRDFDRYPSGEYEIIERVSDDVLRIKRKE